MSQPKSGVSRIIVLVVVVAIVAIVIAKVSSDRRRSTASATPAGSQAVRRIAQAVPPNSTRVGRPEAPASPAAEAPASAAPASGPGRPAAPTPAAAAPSPKPGPPPAQNPATGVQSPKPAQPAAAPAQPAASAEKAKPLPGSDLAASLKSGKVTFVDFGAGWCKACKQMEPVIHKLAADYKGKANIIYVDTDKYPEIARTYRVAAIPAQFVFNAKGEKTVDHLGYWPLEDVTNALAAAGVAE